MTVQEIKEQIKDINEGLAEFSPSEKEQFGAKLLAKKKELEIELSKLESATKQVPKTKPTTPKATAQKVAKEKVVAKAKAKTSKVVIEAKAMLEKLRANKAQTEFNKGRSKDEIEEDAQRKALPAGKRISAEGNTYYENRANRSDVSTKRKPYLEMGGELSFVSSLEQTPNGIYFSEEIYINGAVFMLYPSSQNTKEDIDGAKKWLKDNRDVLGIKIGQEEDLDEIYKGEVFRHPKTKNLKWFQINDDKKNINKARNEGLSIDEYIDEYVLPNVDKTESKMKDKFGNNIYHFEKGGKIDSELEEQRNRHKIEHKEKFIEWLGNRQSIKTVNEFGGFNIGDIVDFTNDNGVVFEDFEILAIEDTDNNRKFYLNKDSYWFPVSIKNLTKKEYATGGSLNEIPFVDVIFKDSQYNYSTSLSKQSTEESSRKYFVGQMFNVGAYPKEIMRECVDIKFHSIGSKKYAKGGKLSNKGAYQNEPESGKSYTRYEDSKDHHRAKPAGWRYTDAGAKRLRISNPNTYVLKDHLEKYRGKYFTDSKGIKHRYIYIERRADKSDIKRGFPYLERGGKVGDLATNSVGKIVEIVKVDGNVYHIKYSDGHIEQRFGEQLNFEKGGSIPNNYEGKTAEQVWYSWDEKQREHFFLDHTDRGDALNRIKADVAAITSWSALDKKQRELVEKHINEGQYKQGGNI